MSDDRRARSAAEIRKVTTTGTLGALLLGVRTEHLTLDVGNELLGKMIAKGYHSPGSDLEKFLS